MMWYDDGTVTIANGATAVAGGGTAWQTAPLEPGDALVIDGFEPVEIASITSEAALVLATAWSGATQTAVAYRIMPVSPRHTTVGRLTDRVRALMDALENTLQPVRLAVGSVFDAGDTTTSFLSHGIRHIFDSAGAGLSVLIRKTATGDTGALEFQTNKVGKARLGLIGDDKAALEVSADGATWTRAMEVDPATGAVTLPQSTPSIFLGANLLLNGDFRVNQRQFAGGALADGAYGFDRWKASATATDLTLAGDRLTLTAGSIAQVMEAPNIAGRKVTVSVEDLSGGTLVANVGGVSGAITPKVGRSGVTIDVPANQTGNVTVHLSLAAGTVTFARVKIEMGEVATDWAPRTWGEELAACQRYYCKSFPYDVAPAPIVASNGVYASFAWHGDHISTQQITFPAEMQGVPTVTLYPQHSASAAIGKWQVLVGGFQEVDVNVDRISRREFSAHLTKPALGAMATGGYFSYGLFTAEAEL